MKYDELKNPGTRIIVRLLEKHEGKDGLKIVQRALNRMGKHLRVDGIVGPITISAIKSVNNRTLHRGMEKLLYPVERENETDNESSPAENDGEPRWITIAKEELGTKEIPGDGSNPRIEQYHSAAGGSGWSDAVPWCASFVAFVMTKAGYKPPKYSARALSWLKFGKSSNEPVLGSIAVKSRRGGGHVTFVVGRSQGGKYLYCLGGNQNDAVNIRKYKASIFIDFRVPTDYERSEYSSLPIMTTDSHGTTREA